ncbi:MAG: thioredoxin [Patescibacteria group bacterium]|jgi:thioredoxin 1
MPEATQHVVVVTDDTFDQIVLKSKFPVVVDCWATWCQPCRVLSPIIDALAAEYAGKIKVCKLDVDDNNKMAEKFGVMSIPTVLFFKDGEVVDTTVGALPKTVIQEHFDKLI